MDTEIEITLRNLKKVKAVEKAVMADQEGTNWHIPKEPVEKRPQRQRTMEDFSRPIIINQYFVVRQPPIDANNFKLKPALITMVQQHQFIRNPSKDPNENLGRFLRMENTVKLNGVNPNVIKLQLFPFSLRDVASSWFKSLRYGSVSNWEEGEAESFYNAWERYKKLLKRCLMHGIEKITQMDIFYHAMNYSSKGIIDPSCCGAFKRKSAEEDNHFIEDLDKSNYRDLSETLGSNILIKGGMIELIRMSAIEEKLDALMRKMSHQERRVHSAHEVGIMEGGE